MEGTTSVESSSSPPSSSSSGRVRSMVFVRPAALDELVWSSRVVSPASRSVELTAASVGREVGRTGSLCQISTWVPTSNTRSGGSPKNLAALAAPRLSTSKRCSRQAGMPGKSVGVTVSLPMK